MDLAAVRDHCLTLPETGESFPFDEHTLVFKVGGKMFALLSLDEIPSRVALKCDPERALDLREEFEAIGTGPYLNTKHWNSVALDGSVPSALVCEMIEDSWRLVVGGLRKAERERLRAVWNAQA